MSDKKNISVSALTFINLINLVIQIHFLQFDDDCGEVNSLNTLVD